MTYIHAAKAEEFIPTLEDGSVELILTDPPYFEITADAWDRQWRNSGEFAVWLSDILLSTLPKLTPTGSLVFFSALGKHGSHPLFQVVERLEAGGFYWRNLVTWKKRRAFGKSHDYLYTREEILWFSKSPDRTSVTYNIPLLDEKRGKVGSFGHLDKKTGLPYQAKSEYLRVTNVWTDIDPIIEVTEIMGRKEHICQKPEKLMDRLVNTHSNRGDLVVDLFAGSGATGVSAVSLGRNFQGCDASEADAHRANERVTAAVPDVHPMLKDL